MENNNHSQPPSFPPPLPPSTSTGKSFAEQAAQVSFFAPLIAFAIGLTYNMAFSREGADGSHRMGLIVVGLVACLMILCSLVFGIIALCGIGKYGTKGILGRALTGIILSCAIGAMGVAGGVAAVRARERAQNNAKVQQAIKDLKEENRKAVDDGTGINSAGERLSKFRKVLDEGAKTASGDDALAMEAASSSFAEMQEKAKAFQAVSQAMLSAHIMRPDDIQTAEDFEPKKQLLQKFLDANEQLRMACTNLVPSYRVELKKRHMAADKIEIAARNYSKGMQTGPVEQIRDCDRRIGENMLKTVDLLQSNWGKWKYDAEKAKVIFQDGAVLQTFNDYVHEIQAASQEEIGLQRKLVK